MTDVYGERASRTDRVDVGYASKHVASERMHLGRGEFCPAGSGKVAHDIYSRPSVQAALPLTDASCSNYTTQTLKVRLAAENLERPDTDRPDIIYDTMGVGRDMMMEEAKNAQFAGGSVARSGNYHSSYRRPMAYRYVNQG